MGKFPIAPTALPEQPALVVTAPYKPVTAEHRRQPETVGESHGWKRCWPSVSERAWVTVRED